MGFAARVRAPRRRSLLVIAAGLVAVGAALLFHDAAPTGPPPAHTAAAGGPPGAGPNVLLVVIDTLRSDQLSCYADSAPPTPHIDRLAADGALFENAYSSSPWTAPSLVSI